MVGTTGVAINEVEAVQWYKKQRMEDILLHNIN